MNVMIYENQNESLKNVTLDLRLNIWMLESH